jgi:dTDP-4-amino-4,6-dideoxygalactose transaminase
MTENRSISCQVKLTEKANEKLGSFKTRLKERNIKMSKSDIINLVLTKMSTAEFEKIATSMAAAENARQKVLQIYENSGMTKEDLEDILKRLVDASFSPSCNVHHVLVNNKGAHDELLSRITIC